MAKYLGNIAHRHDGVNKEYADGVVKDAFWAPVHAVSSVDQILSGVGTLPIVDGVQTVAGYRVLLNGQTDATQNGIYVVTGDATAWQLERASDALVSDRYRSGKPLCVLNGGATYGNAIMTQSSPNLPEGTVLGTAGAVIKFTANASAKDATGVPASATNFTANGTDNDYDITHTFGTTNLIAQVYEVATGLITQADVSPIDNTTVRVSLYPAPANGEVFKLVLVAAQAQLPVAGQSVYDATCTKNGTEYVVGVSGLPSPAPAYYTIRIVAPAALESGDTWTINGDTYTATAISGGALGAGFFAANSVVTMEVDSAGKRCFFRTGGGTTAIGDGTLKVFWGATPPSDEDDGIFVQTSVEPTDLVLDTYPVLTGIEGGVWQNLSDPPALGFGSAIAAQGKYCYLLGGIFREAEYANAVMRYDTVTKVWDKLASVPALSISAKAFVIGDKIYLVGAANDPQTIRILNLTNNTWSTGTPRADVVYNPASVVVGTDIWFLGGTKSPMDPGWQYTKDVAIYNTTTDTWSGGPALPEGRGYGAAAYLDGYLYIFAGYAQAVQNGSQDYNSATGWKLDVAGSTWSKIRSMWTGRTTCSAAVRNGKVYALGGVSQAGAFYGEEYNPQTDKWAGFAVLQDVYNGNSVGLDDAFYVDGTYGVTKKTLLVTASNEEYGAALTQTRHNAGSIMVNGKLAILCGSGNDGTQYYDGVLIDPATGEWESIPSLPDPIRWNVYQQVIQYTSSVGDKVFANYQAHNPNTGTYGYWWYNTTTRAWEFAFETPSDIPIANMQKAVGYGNKIVFVSSGTYWSSQSKTLYTVVFNPADGTYKEITAAPSDVLNIINQQSTSIFTYGTKMYVVPGGGDSSMSYPPTAVHVVDLEAATPTWSTIAIPAELQSDLYFRWNKANFAQAGSKVYFYPQYIHNGNYAMPPRNIIMFDLVSNTFSKFAEVQGARQNSIIGAGADRVILCYGYELFVGLDRKYTFGTDVSVYQEGALVVKTGTGERVKIFDDGTKRMFIAANGVYQTVGTQDVSVNAQFNINGEGWKAL